MINCKKISLEQENRLAKLFKGKRTPASGAKWYCKGDIKTNDFLIEAKTTEQEVYRFSIGIWKKIRREALEIGKIPLICVEVRGKGIRHKINYIIFNQDDFEEFKDLECQSFVMSKVVKLDKDFIINNAPFKLVAKDATVLMMRERDFLDELDLV